MAKRCLLSLLWLLIFKGGRTELPSVFQGWGRPLIFLGVGAPRTPPPPLADSGNTSLFIKGSVKTI